MRIFRFLLIILVSITNQSLATEKDNADLLEGVIRYQGNIFYYPATPNTLYLLGSIEYDSRASIELRRAIRDNNVSKFVLASGGGSVDVGLEYASILRDKSISVYVPRELACLSACTFMFFGGTDRYAGGPVGLHQIWADTDREEKINAVMRETQTSISDVIAILNSFKVPPHLYEHMLKRVGRNFYYLKEQDLEMLDAVDRSNWHSKVDEVLTEAVKKNDELIQLAAFLDPDTVNADLDSTVTSSEQMSDEELAKKIVAVIQELLNEHNCQAGVADGIAGKKTEEATLRFVEATGYEFEEGSDAIVSFMKALETTNKPACGIKQPATEQKKITPTPHVYVGEYLEGHWAVLKRCTSSIDRGKLILTNRRKGEGRGMLWIYDAHLNYQSGVKLDGRLVETALGISVNLQPTLGNKLIQPEVHSGISLNEKKTKMTTTFRKNGCSTEIFRIHYK